MGNIYVHNRASFFNGRESLSRSTENRIISVLNHANIEYKLTNYGDNISHGSIVIANRAYSKKDVDYLLALKQNRNVKILLDIDDYPFHIPSYLFEDKSINVDTKRLINCADSIMVENCYLKEAIFEINNKIYLYPNFFDPRLVFEKRNPKRRILIVNAAGFQLKEESSSFFDALNEFCANHRFNVDFIVDRPEDIKKSIYFNIIKSMSYDDYIKFLLNSSSDYDFFVIPIDEPKSEIDNKYFSCRSHKRFLDVAAMCVPCVVSLVPPYDRGLKLFEHFIPCKKNNFYSWTSALNAIISPDINRDISRAAFNFVRDNYSVDNNIITLKEALTSLQ